MMIQVCEYIKISELYTLKWWILLYLDYIQLLKSVINEGVITLKTSSNDGIGNWDQLCESLSHVCLFMTPWTIACQAPLSMEFSRQE